MAMATEPVSAEIMVAADGLAKAFTLHAQGGVRIPVLDGVGLTVRRGECLVLTGPSGAGKSTLLRCLYANYRPQHGRVLVRHDGGLVDILAVPAVEVLEIRRRTLGYVSQFLRVVPRVPAIELVKEPLRLLGLAEAEAADGAAAMLARLRLPERLWTVAPATFSGGEQQRVNLACAFVAPRPILLLDEPTASLDRDNRDIVVALIAEARARGAALIGIFHDAAVRDAVATQVIELGAARPPAA